MPMAGGQPMNAPSLCYLPPPRMTHLSYISEVVQPLYPLVHHSFSFTSQFSIISAQFEEESITHQRDEILLIISLSDAEHIFGLLVSESHERKYEETTSGWPSQPSNNLLFFGTAKTLETNAFLIISGALIIGRISYWLAINDLKVTLHLIFLVAWKINLWIGNVVTLKC